MICGSCKYAAKLLLEPKAMIECSISDYSDLHQANVSMKECERVMRHEIERAGGVGQWLIAVKAGHRKIIDDTRESWLEKIRELHGPDKCPGGSFCDCQHHILPKPTT